MSCLLLQAVVGKVLVLKDIQLGWKENGILSILQLKCGQQEGVLTARDNGEQNIYMLKCLSQSKRI